MRPIPRRYLALVSLVAVAACFSGLAAPTAHRPVVLSIERLPFTSSSSPAIGNISGDARPEVVVTSDNIGDITRQRDDPRNVNEVAVYGWRDGRFRMTPGWPRHTGDATLGVSIADLDGDGMGEVLAACGQDFAPPPIAATGTWLVSRLYVWKGDGSALAPWYPVNEGTLQGIAYGHAYAAPLVADLNRDGHIEVLHASQGTWEGGGFQHGGLRLYSASGSLLARTQGDFEALPWYTLPGFAMDTPAVLGDLNGDGHTEVVAATFDGHVYAWSPEGIPAPGWFPSAKAQTQTAKGSLLRCPIAAADIDGDGRDEVLAAAYDGALYCWDGAGRLRWRTVCGPAPLTSGVAVGRLRSGNGERDVVVGDARGVVTVCDPKGRIRWRFEATPGAGIAAEPAIGDVNGDGTQDVVIGGTDGYVYALDGGTGALLWQMPTYAAPTPQGMRLESVFGTPSLCDLRGNGHLNIIVATAQRYIADAPSHTWNGFGHVIVFDCGPDTYNDAKLDWPQYRQNAHRTGRYLVTK